MTPDVPGKMASPSIDNVNNVTAEWIYITWTALAVANNGRDIVQYYSLEWDQGNSALATTVPWTELTTNSGSL